MYISTILLIMCVYIYIYISVICVCLYLHIYIYIYRERERKRERDLCLVHPLPTKSTGTRQASHHPKEKQTSNPIPTEFQTAVVAADTDAHVSIQ